MPADPYLESINTKAESVAAKRKETRASITNVIGTINDFFRNRFVTAMFVDNGNNGSWKINWSFLNFFTTNVQARNEKLCKRRLMRSIYHLYRVKVHACGDSHDHALSYQQCCEQRY